MESWSSFEAMVDHFRHEKSSSIPEDVDGEVGLADVIRKGNVNVREFAAYFSKPLLCKNGEACSY